MAHENSEDNSLEAAVRLVAATRNADTTNEQKISPEEKFSQQVFEQILAKAPAYTRLQQEKYISEFCDAFNKHVVEPLKAIRGSNISAEYKKDFVSGDIVNQYPEVFSDDACVITVNGQVIDSYDHGDVVMKDLRASRDGHIASMSAESYAIKIMQALGDDEVHRIARSIKNIPEATDETAVSPEPAL